MTKAPTRPLSGIQKAQPEIIAAGQRHDRQHAGGRIRQHMHIGGAHIVVDGHGMRMTVVMAVIVIESFRIRALTRLTQSPMQAISSASP